jgi:hypothetical protein
MEKCGTAAQAIDDSACRIPEASETHSEYVIIIVSPLQQWLRERVSILRYTYIACLAYFNLCAR